LRYHAFNQEALYEKIVKYIRPAYPPDKRGGGIAFEWPVGPGAGKRPGQLLQKSFRLARHIFGGELYFFSLFIPALPAKSKARKALEAAKGMSVPNKKLSAAGWAALTQQFAAADAALVSFADSLEESDPGLPVKIEWYGGQPDAVPLCFLFNQLVMHTVHHQGQISQILDELKIENDFSAIDVKLLS
jgi:uncharacterized damage-inducible protein DinB